MQSYKIILLISCGWLAGIATPYLWHSAPRLHTVSEQPHTVPRHLAIIMDGNRRWARERGLSPWIGHERGIRPLRETVACCLENGVSYLSVFAFSMENFQRSDDEKTYLFSTIVNMLVEQELPTLKKNGVKINIIGDAACYPESVIDKIAYVHNETKNNTKLTFNLLFCYGGQQDIAIATRAISQDYADGTITQDDITADTVSKYLLTHPMPHPDLVIRTGGRKRISNFLLYQMAYSEIHFLDQYWPDISKDDILREIGTFSQSQRTFGK